MKNNYYRKVLKPIKDLVKDGVPQLGTFSGGFENVNALDVNNLWGKNAPRFLKYFRLKEWQAFQFWFKDYFVFGAVYNAKWVGIIVLSVFNFKTRENQHSFLMVPAFTTKVSKGLFRSVSKAKLGGLDLTINNNLEVNRIHIEGNSKNDKFSLKISGFHIAEPIVVALPMENNRFVYSHKCLMPCEGVMEFNNKVHEVRRSEALLMIDHHKGYYPYKLSYDWATAAWFDRDGNYYGFNLTRNQSIDLENYNENCFWVNGKMHVLPPVKFKFDSENGIWHIHDTYESVAIDFKIVKENSFKSNLGFIKSDYQAPYGTFSGFIKNAHHTLRLNNVNGMGEIKRYRM